MFIRIFQSSISVRLASWLAAVAVLWLISMMDSSFIVTSKSVAVFLCFYNIVCFLSGVLCIYDVHEYFLDLLVKNNTSNRKYLLWLDWGANTRRLKSNNCLVHVSFALNKEVGRLDMAEAKKLGFSEKSI